MKKINVMVLMGGASSERLVSLASGQNVVQNLNSKKFNILPAVISKNSKLLHLFHPSTFTNKINAFSLEADKYFDSKSVKQIDLYKIGQQKIDLVFIALHGSDGEDGKIQGFLDLIGLKYTGSGPVSSAIGMDKLLFRKIMGNLKIMIPPYAALDENTNIKIIEEEIGKPPYFVKPSNQGSSVGMSIVETKQKLMPAISRAFLYSDKVLVDKYIKGKEFTCAILGNEKPVALPVIEIIPKKSDFFDYESKYSEGGADEIVPARISNFFTKRIQNLGLKVYKELGCRGFGRVDFLVKDKKIYVLEINTIPGLTSASLLPKAVEASGMSYSKFLEKAIKLALE